MRKWHGWRFKHRTDSNRHLEVGITQLPDRKMPCLYVMRDNDLEPLTYFQTEEKAATFMGFLDMIAKAEVSE